MALIGMFQKRAQTDNGAAEPEAVFDEKHPVYLVVQSLASKRKSQRGAFYGWWFGTYAQGLGFRAVRPEGHFLGIARVPICMRCRCFKEWFDCP